MYTYISHTHTYIYISYTHITCRHISVWYTYIHKSLLWRLFFWQQDWLCTPPRGCLQHFKTDILPKGIQNYYQIHPGQSFMVAVSIPTAFLSSFGVISHSLNSHFRERQRKRKREKNAKQAKDHLEGNKQITLTRLTRRSKWEGKQERGGLSGLHAHCSGCISLSATIKANKAQRKAETRDCRPGRCVINGTLLHPAYCVLHTSLLNMEENFIKDLATVVVVTGSQ